MKLVEKMRAYELSDAGTPVLGELATAVMQVARGEEVKGADTVLQSLEKHRKDMRGVAYYHATLSDEQYPNKNTGWMESVVQRDLPKFDIKRFRAAVARCVELKDFLALPLCDEGVDPVVKERVVVDGIVLTPKSPTYRPASPTYVPCSPSYAPPKASTPPIRKATRRGRGRGRVSRAQRWRVAHPHKAV
jgi:hypothetical protein